MCGRGTRAIGRARARSTPMLAPPRAACAVRGPVSHVADFVPPAFVTAWILVGQSSEAGGVRDHWRVGVPDAGIIGGMDTCTIASSNAAQAASDASDDDAGVHAQVPCKNSTEHFFLSS